ncbi:MAG: sodium-dependent transporter, partial [Chlamydiae bacterium]|nr:sodium-dependent transporter [Chlamydiota bacterium]
MKQREHWKSRMGFVWAATGSAVGLGSIWRFPYVVGQNGGAAFVLLFCLFLFLVSLPVLISEILIGRKTQLSPQGGYEQIAKGWGKAGFITILTGFIVSSFYSVICGWTLGYLIEALLGNLTHFAKASETVLYFTKLSSSPSWSLGCHFAFMAFSLFVLYFGVQKGIERANKVMMPLLFGILFLLVIKGLMMPNAHEGLKFLFTPNWQALTPQAIITALGQAFFGLSLGQGTMVTYGSYLNKKVDVLALCLPIALSVTIVSLLAGVAIFTVVFSAGVEPTSGTNLMFQTLPIIFSNMPGGHALAVLFFLLIFVAGLTSQISAMEPSISYLIDTYGVKRHKASFFVALGSFLLGIPSALAFGVLGDVKVFGMNIFDAIS